MAEVDAKAAARRQFLRAAAYIAPVIASTVMVRAQANPNSCTPQATCPPINGCNPNCAPNTNCNPNQVCRPHR